MLWAITAVTFPIPLATYLFKKPSMVIIINFRVISTINLLLFLSLQLALEVTGYESPIVVGLHGTLRCTTILNITSIKWYLAATENVLESSSSSVVEYDVTPNSAGLDGTRFTCKAETVTGEIYSKTIAIEVKGVSLLLSVIIQRDR